jgi:cell division protein FtsB
VNLERRLSLVEGREAAVTSQLRTAEAAAAEGETAAAENASLREQLRELKRGSSQLEQHKMVSRPKNPNH